MFLWRRASIVDTQIAREVLDQGEFHNSITAKGRRDENQDVFATYQAYDGFDRPNLFAMYDGHGGNDCAAYLGEHLLEKIATRYVRQGKKNKNARVALDQSFKEVNEEYLTISEMEDRKDGSTATVLFIEPMEERQRVMIHVASVGDSRAIVVYENGDVRRLTEDHTLERQDELKRVLKAGATVKNEEGKTPRIYLEEIGGGLALTRSIGDIRYKPYVIAIPEIATEPFEKAMKYIVLASDGLWNFVTEGKVAKIVSKHGLKSSIKLYHEAYKAESNDNISVTVLDINKMARVLMEHMKSKQRMLDLERQYPLSPGKLVRTYSAQIPLVDSGGYLHELLLWKNPLRSFLWLNVATMIYLLNNWGDYSIIGIGSILLLFHLCIGATVVTVAPLLNRLGMRIDTQVHILESTFMTDELVKRAAVMMHRLASAAFEIWKDIMFNDPDGSKFFPAFRRILYFFYPFSFQTHVYILVLSLFSLPLTYQHNKEVIDYYWDVFTYVWNKMFSYLPFGWGKAPNNEQNDRRKAVSSTSLLGR